MQYMLITGCCDERDRLTKIRGSLINLALSLAIFIPSIIVSCPMLLHDSLETRRDPICGSGQCIRLTDGKNESITFFLIVGDTSTRAHWTLVCVRTSYTRSQCQDSIIETPTGGEQKTLVCNWHEQLGRPNSAAYYTLSPRNRQFCHRQKAVKGRWEWEKEWKRERGRVILARKTLKSIASTSKTYGESNLK